MNRAAGLLLAWSAHAEPLLREDPMPTRALSFPLRHPEQAQWAADPGYDPQIQDRLLAARALVAASASASASASAADRRPEAEAVLLRLRRRAMSRRQEMLLYYLLAQCARARDLSQVAHFGRALAWCGRAQEVAHLLMDRGAQVDLHELRGTLHRAVSLYRLAADEFSLALRLLREHAADEDCTDAEFEITLAAKAAATDYFAGNLVRALEHARWAERLLQLAPVSVEGRGTLAWTFALLYRQRNELGEALRHAEEAADLYASLGPTNSTCRILSLTADIAMDLAESCAGDELDTRTESLARAARRAEEAVCVGQTAGDLPGLHLAELSQVRLGRLSGGPGPGPEEGAKRQARIQAVLRQARAMRDESLLAAAQTALGAELLARGRTARGTAWLRKAQATAQAIDARGLAFSAGRSLRRAAGRNA
jgi:hypothetical protein